MNDYRAFISYRHLPLDRAVAVRLHRMLERYKIPAPYRETAKESRLGRIFRDEDELKLTSDLSAAIRDTLDRSQYLIVLCSPRTKESPWVMQEIDYFLAHHDRNHVLTVLLEGTVAESVPPQLLEADGDRHAIEPLAANIVANTQGRVLARLRGEFLRIVAAMLGCSYDALRQRKKQYYMKRMLVILAIVFAVVVSFLFMLMDRNRQIQKQYDKAQLNESQMLALLSEQALGQEDRMKAVEYALTALGDEENERPYVPEAELALANALYAYQDPAVRPRIRLAQPLAIEQIAGRENYVTLDWAGMVRGFSGRNGNMIWQRLVSPNIQSFLYSQENACSIFVDDTPRVVVLDEEDGSVRWMLEPNTYVIACAAISADQSMIALLYEDEENLDNCIADIRSMKDGTQLSSVSFSLDGAGADEMAVRFTQDGSALAVQTFFYEDGTSRYTVISLEKEAVIASMDSSDEAFELEEVLLKEEMLRFDKTDFAAGMPEKEENTHVVYEMLGDEHCSVLDELDGSLTACFPLPSDGGLLEIIRKNYQAECRVTDGAGEQRFFSVRLSGRHATTEIAGITSDGRYAMVGGEMIDLEQGVVVPLAQDEQELLFLAHDAAPDAALRTVALVNSDQEENEHRPVIRRWINGREQNPLHCPYPGARYDIRESVLLETAVTGMIAISLHSNTVTRDMERIALYREDKQSWSELPYACKQEELPHLALGEKSPLCAIVTYDGELGLYDAEKSEYRWRTETGFAGYLIEEVRFCAQDRFIFVYAHNQIMLYSCETGECVNIYTGFTGKDRAPWPRIAFSLIHDEQTDSLFVGAYECFYESGDSAPVSGIRIDLETGKIRTMIEGLCFYEKDKNAVVCYAAGREQPALIRYPCYTTKELINQGKILLEQL